VNRSGARLPSQRPPPTRPSLRSELGNRHSAGRDWTEVVRSLAVVLALMCSLVLLVSWTLAWTIVLLWGDLLAHIETFR
jgi:hypothetical protein